MRIEIRLNQSDLKGVRLLLKQLHMNKLLAWWRNVEKRHWAIRGLVHGVSKCYGPPDFTLYIGEKRGSNSSSI